MPFKLTKDESNRRDELVNDLRDKYTILEAAINEDPQDPDDISSAAATFQVIVSEAEALRDEVATRLRDEFDEKSDKWREGEKGEAANQFIGEWEDADFSDCDLDLANPLDIDLSGLDDHAETLDNLPSEAE